MDAEGQCARLQGQEAYVGITPVGKGSFGQVWKAVHSRTEELVAIKLLPRGEKCDKSVRRELVANVKLSHPHIVRCRNLFLTDTHLAIVFDYCSHGNLQQYVSLQGPLPEAKARCFFQQLILAVSYMHSEGIVNRDIKLENAMLDGEHLLLKLTDFGYAIDIDSQPISKVGTPNYAAPEVISPEQRNYDGGQADVWSCAVFLYVCLFRRYPFERPDDPRNQHGVAKVLQRTIACNYELPADIPISPDCRDMLQRMLVKDPEQRFTIHQIMAHPFFLTELPLSALSLNSACRRSRASQAELQWKKRWVRQVWEQAREEVGRASPQPEAVRSYTNSDSSRSYYQASPRRPVTSNSQPSHSGYSIPGFEQAFQQQISINGPRHYTLEE